MSQVESPEQQTRDPIISRLFGFLNEEKLIKDITAVQLSRIKTLDDFVDEVASSSQSKEVKEHLEESLAENEESLVARYLLGCLGLAEGRLEDLAYLRSLLEDLRKSAKWTIVDHIADRILEKEAENRFALRAKVESTERLKGKKELRPYLEKLASIDRKNPEILKKYAQSIFDEDRPRALSFLKQAGETYARVKDYRNLEDIWSTIVQNDHTDFAWFERIERILIGNREKTRAAALYTSLVEPYKNDENWNTAIVVLKKIIEYEPASTRMRTELVRVYRARYAGHSLLEEFLKMSDLTNNRKPPGPAIASFERNIVFDNDNFVYHKSRGVGKIKSIDKDHVIVDFSDFPDQKMSIQMAISSLQPLGKEHIWVKRYENPAEIAELFNEDVNLFFEMLLSSFDNSISLSDIKSEICDRYIPAKDWSKWWSRTRTQLKKDPRFGFNPRKKDELLLRETPMSLSEELSMKFQSVSDWNKKLELALETLKDTEAEGALHLCMQFYHEQENNKDLLKRLHSFYFLEMAVNATGDDDFPRTLGRKDIDETIAAETARNLIKFCQDTPSLEFKRELVNSIIKVRPDYPQILLEILFELPIRIHRTIINELNRLGKTEELQEFIARAFKRFREAPEIFLWVARSIITGQWNYDWLKETREEAMLSIFRLLKPLGRFEEKGTRLKNLAIETLFGTTNLNMDSVRESPLATELEKSKASTVRRMAALFRDVPYIPDAHKENLIAFFQEKFPDFGAESVVDEDAGEETPASDRLSGILPPDDVILVSRAGLEARKAHLHHLIQEEMPANSREIHEAQEKGDLRENAEYKAAMERHDQLRAEITRVDAELKKAQAIDPQNVRTDVVSIGSRVKVQSDGKSSEYTILGTWDTDADRNVISYQSPLAMALLGLRPGEEGALDQRKFRIESIQSAL